MGSIDAYWQQHWQQWLELNEWWQLLKSFKQPTFIPSIATSS